jgi:hypothetical protein
MSPYGDISAPCTCTASSLTPNGSKSQNTAVPGRAALCNIGDREALENYFHTGNTEM